MLTQGPYGVQQGPQSSRTLPWGQRWTTRVGRGQPWRPPAEVPGRSRWLAPLSFALPTGALIVSCRTVDGGQATHEPVGCPPPTAHSQEVPQGRIERPTLALGVPCSIHLSYWGVRLIIRAPGAGDFSDGCLLPATRIRQPKANPSATADFGSGNRRIRSEFSKPMSAASSGTSRATWSATGLASVLMRMISSWISAG